MSDRSIEAGYVHKAHTYGRPQPGQGSSREAICTKCGVRRSVAGQTECPGKHPDIVTPTVHDYEPF